MFSQGCAAFQIRGAEAPLPHFFKVDDHLYRGAQPSPDGFRELARMGVKTIVSLRAEHNWRDQEEQAALAESLGMRWVYLPMHFWWRPKSQQALNFLEIVRGQTEGPVFIHCRQGEDRTGTMVAIYRVVEQGWDPKHAYAEARALGLGANPLMKNVILHEAKDHFHRQLARKSKP
jgi:uncharacterized protein (TIGR01244 family)